MVKERSTRSCTLSAPPKTENGSMPKSVWLIAKLPLTSRRSAPASILAGMRSCRVTPWSASSPCSVPCSTARTRSATKGKRSASSTFPSMLLRVPAMSDSLGGLSKPAAARCAGSAAARPPPPYKEAPGAWAAMDKAADVRGRHYVVVAQLRQPAAAVDPDDDERIPRLGPVNLCATLRRFAVIGRVEIRSSGGRRLRRGGRRHRRASCSQQRQAKQQPRDPRHSAFLPQPHVELDRSEEHTSELQSLAYLV